jgi:[acyl-carrier-protein] S-malonyltransferase
MSIAFQFPGQGSQFVGMGKALAEAYPEARTVFEEVDDAVGFHLSQVIFEGPLETLTLTANTQPALMAVSLAALRVLEQEAGVNLARDVACVAGHSLGEYSALAAAGALSISDAARLLRLRGESMQQAVAVGVGAMASIFGFDLDTGRQIAAEAQARAGGGEVCEVANDNGSGQLVVSGTKAGVEQAVEIAKSRGSLRFMFLPVSAPFHCSLMQPAADAMRSALAAVELRTPVVPIVANFAAEPVIEPERIRELLVAQVTGTVRWRECVQTMIDQGVTTFVEIGAGKVLTGLLRRMHPGSTAMLIGTPDDARAAVGKLI